MEKRVALGVKDGRSVIRLDVPLEFTVARVVLIGRCVIIGDGLVKGGDLVDRLFEVSKERKGNDDKEDF